MKTVKLNKIFTILFPALFSFLIMNAQVATWNFNGVLTGTGSANSIASSASLGPVIAAGGAFNGNVYYGEGTWPSGSIDLGYYLEFSITPTAGHSVTVSNLVMQIRRSTTGVSGSGPNNWSLRSSLDGYATDISNGTLITASTPATVVSLGSGFMNLPAKITFRLYGYNATVSSGGGLNRFVYDDIQAGGSTVLPVAFDFFKVKTLHQSADISWKLSGEGNLSSLRIERADDGVFFQEVKEYNGEQINTGTLFDFVDELNNPSGMYAYRLKMISENGQVSYSNIQTVSFDAESGFQLKAINTGNARSVSFRVYTDKPGNYVFSLFNLNGNKVAVKSAQLFAGSESMQMDNGPLKSGMYILLGENGNQKISTKIMLF
jgi:hypothetical protein